VDKDERNKELNTLIEMCKNGNLSAFDEIYNRCKGHITFVCSKFCDSKEDIEEIVQDTFMDAFKKVKELRSDTFVALLRKIAVRKCYNKHKNNKGSPTSTISDQDVEVAVRDKDFLPEEYMQSKEMRAEILRIINELPPKQREVIYLYYYTDINTEEIAKISNCSSANIRQALHKARNTIKNKIGSRHMPGIAIALLAEEATFMATHKAAGTAAVTGSVTSGIAAAVCGVMACVVIVGAVFMYESESNPPVPIAEDALVEIMREAPEMAAIHEPQELQELQEPQALQEPQEPRELQQPQEAYEPQPDQVDESLPYGMLLYAQPEPPEPVVPEPEEPPELIPIPDPAPIDRTAEILAALKNATRVGMAEVYRVIEYYDFALVTEMRTSEYELFWFYVLDDGSGDILVGLAEYESGWRTLFEHFTYRQRPKDRLDMFSWMEG